MAQEQDQLLPIATVGRIMKQILPPNAKISKEAKETLQECATEFISFVTGEASYKCHNENRKTLTGNDICRALSALGFDNYAEAIVRYLHKFREAEREKASSQNKATCCSCQDKDNIEESSEDNKSGQPAAQQQNEQAPATALEL